VRLRAFLTLLLGSMCLAAAVAAPASAADECKGLRVCLPVAGPWVVASTAGVDWELACPVRGYVIGGTDARVATKDVDVSVRGETGSPVGPGVTTRSSLVFHGIRTRAGAGTSSFQPFLGCIPSNGGGGRALTGVAATAPGFGLKPSHPLFSVVVTATVVRRTQTVRAACPSRSVLVGATHAVGFGQTAPPTSAQRAAVSVRRSVVEGAVVARVTAGAAAGPRTQVQVRALCARVS
jgi:hypothetical protein